MFYVVQIAEPNCLILGDIDKFDLKQHKNPRIDGQEEDDLDIW